ncbi:hypothetical protein ACSSS7_003581 [Eimeria intestinalis]
MRTQTASLWLVALGSASLGSSVKEDLDREAAEGGEFNEESFAPPQESFPQPEKRPPPREEGEGASTVDRKVRSVLNKVKNFFGGKALRRKAELAQAIQKFSSTPQAQQLMSCIGLASRTKAAKKADSFCRRFQELTLRGMCLKTADEASRRMEFANAKCGNKKGSRNGYQFAPTPLPVIDFETFKWRVEWPVLKELFDSLNGESPSAYAIMRQMRSLFEGIQEKANKTDSRRERDQLFWQAWQLLVRTMQIPPRVDPMLVGRLLDTLSFKGCSNRKIQLPGMPESVSERHVRTNLLGYYFASALRLDECAENPGTPNCKTLEYYARMSNTLTKFFLPLHENAMVEEETPLYGGGELEASNEAEHNALRDDIEEELQSNVTFVVEVAEQISMRLVDFIARSRIARNLMTVAVTNIMRFAGHLREEEMGEGAAGGSIPTRNELLRSAIALDATAQVAATVRELYVFVMSGRRALSRIYGQVTYKVLSRELKQLRKKSLPKRSLGQRFRSFFKFGRGQSSLQVDDASALMPVQRQGAMARNASRWTPRRMEASFVQSDKDKRFNKRNVFLLAGGTFIFLGIAVLSSVAPGALGVGLIVAGIVAMLIPLVGKLAQLVTGRIRRAPGRTKLLALPAPPPRGPEEPQPPQGLSEPEEDQSPQGAEASTEASPEDDSGQTGDLPPKQSDRLTEADPEQDEVKIGELRHEEVD